jgi:phospholipase/lecithinase/hemolysin
MHRHLFKTKALATTFIAIVGALVLTACGSGSFADPFVPKRVVAFGDEASMVPTDGYRYTVNGLTNGQVDCTVNPIWLQRMTNGLGVPINSCPGTATSAPSVSRATVGATVAGVQSQIDQHLASDTLGETDLVTIYAGLHDILAGYAAVAAEGETVVTQRLQAAGKQLGGQINRIALAGTPVIVITQFNLGVTPYGLAAEAATPGAAALLNRLTVAFNVAMRVEMVNDGRRIGLVDNYDLITAVVKVPTVISTNNATTAVCTTPLPRCTTATVLLDGTTPVEPSRYVWSDGLHFGSQAHLRLGELAEARARNNPF